MSYENPIPPVPSRAEEIFMIQKAQKSLKNHPKTKLILNEANRTQQLEILEMKKRYNRIWYRNFVRGAAVMTIPCMFLAISFRKGKYGIPRYRISKFYDAFELSHQQSPRILLVLKFASPVWILGSYFYAQYSTSMDGIFDEYYTRYNSVKLPYQLNLFQNSFF